MENEGIVLPVNDGAKPNLDNNEGKGNEPVVKPDDKTQTTDETVEIEGKSYKLDADGNALDEEGKVFKTKDELTTPANEEVEIEIDNVSYKLDKDGNALKEDGTIFMKKEDIDALSNTSEPSFEDIIKLTGVQPLDEQGKPITYDLSVDGIASYVKDSAEYIAKQTVSKTQNKFWESNPDILALWKHKQIHGTIEGYTPTVDYSKVELKSDNPEQLTAIIVESRIAKGDTKAEAEQYAEYLKTDGKLMDGAKVARDYMVNKRKELDAQQDLLIEQRRKAEKEEAAATYNTVKEKIIDKGVITVNDETFALPKIIRVKTSEGKFVERSQEDFFNFVMKPIPVKIGNETYTMTADEYAQYREEQTKTLDHDLLAAYLRFTGGDTSSLVKKQIQNQKVKELRTLITKKVSTKPDDVRREAGKITLPVK